MYVFIHFRQVVCTLNLLILSTLRQTRGRVLPEEQPPFKILKGENGVPDQRPVGEGRKG